MAATAQEQAVINQFGPGLSLVSKAPPTDPLKTYPAGSEQWTIVNAQGKSSTMVVTPPAAPPAATDPDFAPSRPPSPYLVVDPPTGLSAPVPSTKEEDHQIIEVNGRKIDYYPNRPIASRYVDLGVAGTPKAPVTPAAQLEIVPDPTTGKPIKLRDPSTGTIIDLDPAAKPEKPQLVQGPNGALDSWDGVKLTSVRAGTAAEVKPTDGQTRSNVAGGYEIREKFSGGQWVTDPTFTPKPYDPTLAGKPKEGDARPNTDNKGQAIQEVFRGGSWVTDTSVPPKPFGTQAPTNVSAPANQENIAQQDPTTGAITWVPNRNFSPADVAGQVQQLQAQAKAERDRINAQAGKTEVEKNAEFEMWWQANVEPKKQQIDAAQKEAQRKIATEQAATQRQGVLDETSYERNRQADARQAGRDVVADVNATLPYRVGPGFGANFAKGLNTLSSGGGAVSFGANDFTFDMPDTAALAEQATAKALAGISPYAAMKANQPMPAAPPAGMDIASMLNPGRYSMGAPAAAPPTKVTLPDGTVIEAASATAPTAPSAPSVDLPEFADPSKRTPEALAATLGGSMNGRIRRGY